MTDFKNNKSSLQLRMRRLLHRVVDSEPAPSFTVIKQASFSEKWILFFCYLPDNKITEDHYLTIRNLNYSNYKLMIVVAATDNSVIKKELMDLCDSLIIKDLPGYDFSGYSIGIRHILQRSNPVDIIVINDSVIGPITELIDILENRPWGLTGITSCETRENHIQSYAFMFKNINNYKFDKLSTIFPKKISYSKYMAVVRMQESRFARVAANHMTVGSIWHSEEDMTVYRPIYLLDSGYPFIKKSLFSKFAHFLSELDKNRLEEIRLNYKNAHNISKITAHQFDE